MKKLICLLLCFIFFISLSSCSYNPPEGWTKKHHTYEEILEFARSIDPDATVTEEYTDTLNEYEWEFREWAAVINGIDCHVASISDWVWNDGIGAGEFAKTYYRIYTDYDYTVINNIISDEYPEWKSDDTIENKYHHNTNTIFIELNLPEYRILNDEELEQVWQTANEINEKYKKLALERKAGFSIPSPGMYWNHDGEQEYFVRNDSFTSITEFTENGKTEFLKEYQEAWTLLDSGLPVVD